MSNASSAIIVDSNCLIKEQAKAIKLTEADYRYLYIVSTVGSKRSDKNSNLFLKTKKIFYYLLNVIEIRQNRVRLPQPFLKNLTIRYLQVTHIKNNWFSFTDDSLI